MAWIDLIQTKETFKESKDGLATAQRIFYARNDAVFRPDAALVATFGALTIPARREAFSATRPFCRATDRNVRMLSPRQAEVTVDFVDPTPGSDDGSVTSLLNQPAIITRSSVGMMEEYSVDHSTPPKRVVNTAGAPFDRNPERRKKLVVYQVRKYVTLATSNLITAAMHTTNSAAKSIKGFNHEPETLFLADVASENITDTIEALTISIEYDPQKFIDRTPSVGRHVAESLSGGGTGWVAILDDTGEIVSEPWPLNELGGKMSAPTDTPFEIEFRPYPKNAWAGVPLS